MLSDLLLGAVELYESMLFSNVSTSSNQLNELILCCGGLEILSGLRGDVDSGREIGANGERNGTADVSCGKDMTHDGALVASKLILLRRQGLTFTTGNDVGSDEHVSTVSSGILLAECIVAGRLCGSSTSTC